MLSSLPVAYSGLSLQALGSGLWEFEGKFLISLSSRPREGPQAAEKVSQVGPCHDCHRDQGYGRVQCPEKVKAKGKQKRNTSFFFQNRDILSYSREETPRPLEIFVSLLFAVYGSLPLLGQSRSLGLIYPGFPKLGTGQSLGEARWECS